MIPLAALGLTGLGLVILYAQMPVRWALPVLVGVRTFTDASFIPDAGRAVLNLGVGLCSVVLIVRVAARLHPQVVRASAGVIAFVSLYACVTFLVLHFDANVLSEVARAASVCFVTAAAVVVAREAGTLFTLNALLLAFLPSACANLLAFAGAPGLAREDGRAAGLYVHPNAGAAALGACFLVCISLMVVQRRAVTRYVALAVVFGLATISTVSLGGIAGTLIGLIVVIVCANNKGSIGRRLVLGVVLPLGIFSAVSSNVTLRERVFSISDNWGSTDVHDNSLIWRFANWGNYLELWRQHPTFGWGWGSTTTDLTPYTKAPHSTFVQLLVETGVAGLVVVCLALIGLVVTLVRALFQKEQYAVVGFAVFVSALTQSTASNMLSYTAALFAICPFVALGVRAHERAPDPIDAVVAAPRHAARSVVAAR